MKPVKIYSQLLLLSLFLMSMGFPSVIAEDEADQSTHKSKSVRYVKVGFLACTRQVANKAEDCDKIQEPKCVNINKQENKPEEEAPTAISAKVGGSVSMVSYRIRHWLNQWAYPQDSFTTTNALTDPLSGRLLLTTHLGGSISYT